MSLTRTIWRRSCPLRLSKCLDQGCTRRTIATFEMPAVKDLEFMLDDSGVAVITLQRPHRLNALSEDMGSSIMKLADFLSGLPAERVRVCVIHGGSRAFSTGRDLKDSKLHVTLEQRQRYLGIALESVLAVHGLPMPTIAAISGPCFGWGLELALGCDLRVATPDATLCLPETSLGIFPGAGGCVFLRDVVSASVAKDLVFTARRFTGHEAKELGVVNRVSKDAFAEGIAVAQQIAGNGPLGVRSAKEVIESVQQVPFKPAMRLSTALRSPLSETEDFKEALDAFEQKRKAVFKGR